jgi:NAD-dependent dihydropyrimidine dehydrogenase PreA subunit
MTPLPEDVIADCRHEPGVMTPVVDRNRCEAKADCVRVCPYGVFEIDRLRPEDRRGLTLLGRLKSLAHGGRQAFAVRADACHGCGLCVTACPEHAITLRVRTG